MSPTGDGTSEVVRVPPSDAEPIGCEIIKVRRFLPSVLPSHINKLRAKDLKSLDKMKWSLREIVSRVPCTACWRCGAAAAVGKKCLRCTAQN